MMATGIAWSIIPNQDADLTFDPFIREPTFPKTHPLVLIDEAHANAHRAAGRMLPFVWLAQQDGYRVAPNRRRFAGNALAGCNILVIVNALGWRGAAQQLLNTAGLEGT